MAEKSNNVDELNRLAQDGRIAQKEDDKEHKKDVQEASKGKKTIEEVEQIIDETELLEELYRNKMFANMIQPCLLEGENLLGKLKGYFEVHKVRPSDLVKEIQTQVNEKRLEINRDSQTLFFGEDGSIDEGLSIEKAVKNQRPVARYIRNVYMEEGKQLPEMEDHTLHGKFILSEQPREYIDSLNREIFEETRKIEIDFVDFLNRSGSKLVKTSDGVMIPMNKDYTKEGNVILGKFWKINKTLAEIIDPDKMSEMDIKVKLVDVLACYKEIQGFEKLSDDELMAYGIKGEELDSIRALYARVKECAEKKFSRMTNMQIDKMTDEELSDLVGKENWKNVSGKREEIRADAENNYEANKDRFDLNVEEKIVLESENEIVRANRIRMLRMLNRLERRTDVRFHPDEDALISKRLFSLVDKDDEILKEAVYDFRETNEIDLLANALVRKRLLEDMDILNTKGFTRLREDNPVLTLQGQFARIMPAIVALNINPKNASREDLEVRAESIKTLVNFFPEIVDDSKNFDSNDENVVYELKNRMFNVIKNTYIPVFEDGYFGDIKFKDIQNFNQLADRIEARYLYRIKSLLVTAVVQQGMLYDEVESMIEDPEVLSYMERESKKEKRALEEDQLYVDLSKAVLEGRESKLKDNSNDKYEYVIKLATVLQIYEQEEEDRETGQVVEDKERANRNKKLVNEAKRNLADILPNVFDDEGNVDYVILEYKLAEISGVLKKEVAKGYDEYQAERGIGSFRLEYLSKKIREEKTKKIESEVVNLDTTEESKKNTQKSIAELNKDSIIEGAERVLQLVHYLSDKRQDRKAEHLRKKYGYKGEFRVNKNSGSFKDAVENVEEVYRKRVEVLYEDDTKSNKSFTKISDHDFDDTIFPGMIREGKRKAANKKIKPVLDKYETNEDILDDEAKNIIITTYLGILDDNKTKEIPESKESVRNLQGRLLKFLGRINPDLTKDGKVDIDLLLEEYKKVTTKPDIDTIEDAKFVAEDEIIEDFLVGLVNDKTFEKAINKEELRTCLKVFDAKERQDNFLRLESIGKLLATSLHTRYDFSSTKADEVDLIKGLYLITKMYGDKNLDRTGLTQRNERIQSLEKRLLDVAKQNLKFYFNDVIDVDNRIDTDKLDETILGYLEQYDPKMIELYKSGNDITDLIKEELFNRQEMEYGPFPPNDDERDEDKKDKKDKKDEIVEIDRIDRQMSRLEKTLNKCDEEKEDYKYLTMINIIVKMREKSNGIGGGKKVAQKFEEKRPGILEKWTSGKYQMEVDDSYIDYVVIMGAKRQIDQINEQYFKNDNVNLDELSAEDKKTILRTALGATEVCREDVDYKSVTKGYDTRSVALNMIKRLVPDAVNSNREIDRDKIYETMSTICEEVGIAKPLDADTVFKNAYRKICVGVIKEFRDYTPDKNLPYFDILENSKLRSTIKSEREDPEITNSEMDPVFQSRAETLDVDDKKVKEAKDTKTVENKGKNTEQPVIGDAEVDKAMADKSEELHHDVGKDKAETKTQAQTRTEETVVEETSTPKVEQQSDKLNKDTKGIAVENINVAPVEPEKSMVTTESRGFMSDVITKIKNIPNLIKNGINNIKERLGIGQSSSSNNTETGSTSTSSTGGVTKTEQDVVQNLTGYGQQNLDLNAAKAATQNETGKKVSEKGNELEGNEENERD